MTPRAPLLPAPGDNLTAVQPASACRQSDRTGGGALNSQQERLLQESFVRLKPRMDAVIDRLYERLTSCRPECVLCHGDELALLGKQTCGAIHEAVHHARALENARSALRELGEAHRRCGLRQRDLPLIRASLVEAIRSVTLIWTNEELNAWKALVCDAAVFLCQIDEGKIGNAPEGPCDGDAAGTSE